MATVGLFLRLPNLRDGYVEVVRWVAEMGKPSNPRGRETREIVTATIVVEDPTDCLPVGVGRKLNTRIAAVEACQLIAKQARPDLVTSISENFRQYAEHDGQFHGNYGSRIGTQLLEACWKLRADPNTRQAVITLWDPHLDNLANKRDYPCTLSLQLLLRDDELHLITTMRSNDAWLGLAFDGFQFTQLQLTAARILGVEPGRYVHHANSLHLYQDDLDAGRVDQLETTLLPKPTDLPEGFGLVYDCPPEHAVARAQCILNNNPLEDETSSEAWYRRRLHTSEN